MQSGEKQQKQIRKCAEMLMMVPVVSENSKPTQPGVFCVGVSYVCVTFA